MLFLVIIDDQMTRKNPINDQKAVFLDTKEDT
jgi:hypothetical protein